MACATSPRRNSRWYTANEVKEHCTLHDCWITLLGNVYDITQLIPRNPRILGMLLVNESGGDISRWFDPETGSVTLGIDAISLLKTYQAPPEGRFVHIPPNLPRSDWNMSFDLEWWKDPQYIIGQLSRKTRWVRVKNVLIDQEILLEVPSEEHVRFILERYLAYNAHARSYTWKAMIMTDNREFICLDMNKTLKENGIQDEADMFVELGLPRDFYIPVLHLYYEDDLTVA